MHLVSLWGSKDEGATLRVVAGRRGSRAVILASIGGVEVAAAGLAAEEGAWLFLAVGIGKESSRVWAEVFGERASTLNAEAPGGELQGGELKLAVGGGERFVISNTNLFFFSGEDLGVLRSFTFRGKAAAFGGQLLGLRFTGSKVRATGPPKPLPPIEKSRRSRKGLNLGLGGEVTLGKVLEKKRDLPVSAFAVSVRVVVPRLRDGEVAVILQGKSEELKREKAFCAKGEDLRDLPSTSLFGEERPALLVYLSLSQKGRVEATLELLGCGRVTKSLDEEAGVESSLSFWLEQRGGKIEAGFVEGEKEKLFESGGVLSDLRAVSFWLGGPGREVTLQTIDFLDSRPMSSGVEGLSRCVMGQTPYTTEGCVHCRGGVKRNGRCVRFCPRGFRGAAGACERCRGGCEFRVSLSAARLNATDFIVWVTPPLPELPRRLTSLAELRDEGGVRRLLGVVFRPISGGTFGFSLKGVSNRSVMLRLRGSSGGLGHPLGHYLCDSSTIINTPETIKIPTILSGLGWSLGVVALMVLAVLVGGGVEAEGAKMIEVLQRIQLTVLLVFVGVPLPVSLLEFLRSGFAAVFGTIILPPPPIVDSPLNTSTPQPQDYLPSLPNLFAPDISPQFSNNLLIFCISLISFFSLSAFFSILSNRCFHRRRTSLNTISSFLSRFTPLTAALCSALPISFFSTLSLFYSTILIERVLATFVGLVMISALIWVSRNPLTPQPLNPTRALWLSMAGWVLAAFSLYPIIQTSLLFLISASMTYRERKEAGTSAALLIILLISLINYLAPGEVTSTEPLSLICLSILYLCNLFPICLSLARFFALFFRRSARLKFFDREDFSPIEKSTGGSQGNDLGVVEEMKLKENEGESELRLNDDSISSFD